MKILTLLLLFTGSFLLLLPLSHAQQERGQGIRQVSQLPSKAKRYALLIGVDRYDDAQINGLTGATNDTKALEEALVRNAGFDQDRIIRLASDQPREYQPTRGNILKFLSNALRAMPSDGLLWLAFSGHGVERNRRAFLLPADAQVNDDVKLLEKTAIEVADIKEMIRDKRDANGNTTGVSQVVILLDACRNDPTSGRDLSGNPMTKAYDFNLRNSGVQAFVTLYATSVGNRAYEDPTRRMGYFIAEVVAGLQGAAANANGEITLERLIEHVEEKVPTKVSLRLGRDQRPFHELEGYRSGLVLAVTTPVTPPVITPRTLTPVIALPAKVAVSRLAVHTFMTAAVNDAGKVTKFSGTPTQQYTEDLGNGVRLEMVAIKGGIFQRNAPVTVSDFWIGKFEVTQAQWQTVMGDNPSRFRGDNLPVENVSWDDAKEFCRELNAKLGLSEANGYRLPTEAEWEYAARAGSQTEYAFGDAINSDIVNATYLEKTGVVVRKKTVVVGSLGVANGWGIFDMHGNVWEWCSDWYGIYPIGAVSNPRGASTGSYRVGRGGGWSDIVVDCRSASRFAFDPFNRYYIVGFRLVRQ